METTSKTSDRRVRFDPFELDLSTRELHRNGQRLKLRGHPIDVLAVLLERPGEPVTREELQKRLWPQGTFVDHEQILNNSIRMLRDALGDKVDAPRFIETLPRLGYRFIAPVRTPAPGPAPETRAQPRKWTGKLAAVAAPLATHWISVTAIGAALTIVAVLYALTGAGLRDLTFEKAPPPHIESIAVLPLANLSGDPEQQYFADGITEELITDLGQIGSLRVISRTSVMRYKDTTMPLPEIARELNVDAIVEGTVQRFGNKVRITANLLHAPTDRHLWAASYERNMQDVLRLQADVAYAIVSQISTHVAPQMRLRPATTKPVNPAAYDHYLKARYHYFKWQPKEFQLAAEEFQKAIDADPGWAPPYVGLADSYGFLWMEGVLPAREVLPRFNAALGTALEIDDKLPEVRYTLAVRAYYYLWNWDEAEREFKRALSLNPNFVEARFEYAWFLGSMGRRSEALIEAKRAVESDPLSVPANLALASIYVGSRHDDKAIAQLRKTIDLDPNDPRAYNFLSNIYARRGDYDKAMGAFQKAATLAATPPEVVAAQNQAYRSAGYRGVLMMRLKKISDPYFRALLHVQLGNKNEALTSLEQAYAEHSWAMIQLPSLPLWDPLRSDPRFQKILRRMNFPP